MSRLRNLGYPVMFKAAAGGGGKGMRIVRKKSECAPAFELASGEARASFGDERVFVEKYIEGARHIEIQILADAAWRHYPSWRTRVFDSKTPPENHRGSAIAVSR